MFKVTKKVIPFVVGAALSMGAFAIEPPAPRDPFILSPEQAERLLGGTPRMCVEGGISEHCIHEAQLFADIHHIALDVHRIEKDHHRPRPPKPHHHHNHHDKVIKKTESAPKTGDMGTLAGIALSALMLGAGAGAILLKKKED